MALKDILVHLDSEAGSDAILAVAVGLARRHGAHLTGLYALDMPRVDYLYGSPLPLSGIAADEIVTRMRQDTTNAAAPVEAHFRETLRKQGIEGEWRLVEGDTTTIVPLHARYADLTVVGQPNPMGPRDDSRRGTVIVATLMSSGRPVLAIPYAGHFPVVGDRVLVAWNASREASRAVHDAMPLLQQATLVTVLAINPRYGIGGHGDVPAADIALHLARHGVKAEAAHTVGGDISDGEALLSYAADLSIDLIVCGGYGHSRARELVFGGVTRTLLKEMTAPILLSH